MEWYLALALLMLTISILLIMGTAVAIAFFATNIVFAYLFLGGEVGIVQFVRSMVGAVGNYTLAPIPLFILMGELMFHTGLAGRAIEAIDRLITRVPGRLGVVAVGSGTVFSALTGSSLATVATLGSSLVPEMTNRGYKPALSVGPILATGGLAVLIPPSGLAVILGSLGGISISGLLLGGIIPAIIMSLMFTTYIVTRAIVDPSSAPSYDTPHLSMKERFVPFALHVLPLLLVFVVVIGSMLSGVSTITEASAMGTMATLALAAIFRQLTAQTLMRSLAATATVSVMIFTIIAGSATFSQILAVSGVTSNVLQYLLAFQMDTVTFISLYMAVVLVMGCFLDPIAILMLTLPFFLPLAQQMNINLVWLGILIMIGLEMSFITPPFGLSIFVLKGITPPEITTTAIYKAVYPFILIQIVAIFFIIFVPELATWLPDLIRR